jgi:hypothetical protein
MAAIPRDPFGERRTGGARHRATLLGVGCEFHGPRRLLALVDQACGRLPAQRLPGVTPACRIDLRLVPGGRDFGALGPPAVRAASGAGLLTGIVDADNHVIICPELRRASIAISESQLARPYHARYELIEFALLTLLARVRGLMPLHAACVGDGSRGLLLLGDSGAGKSTLCVHAALAGLPLLAEDSLFVEPRTLTACALPAFVHLRPDGLRFLDARRRREVRASPVIRRRNGQRKYEIDLRRLRGASISGPQRLVATVRLERNGPARLRAIDTSVILGQLRREQSYAAAQTGWRDFQRGVARLPAYALGRGAHPLESVHVLDELLKELDP